MTRRTLGVVLLVSLSHAMVHTYELVYPAVEQELQRSWGLSVEMVGIIANAWALPFGLGAMAAGWFADRIGSRRVLIIYLLGCSLACLAVGFATSLSVLLPAMFAMGAFASLYHPAGLAYISRMVPRKTLGLALGYHGILGSFGIAGASVVAGTLLTVVTWQGVYLALIVPGVLLAALFWLLLPDDAPREEAEARPTDDGDWRGFASICLVTMLFGMIYRGFITFLPRYLSDVHLPALSGLSPSTARNYLTGGVLMLGVFGQYGGGWLCGRVPLERLLVFVTAINVPFLLWLGAADGTERLVATGAFAVFHFMMQPVGNSLIARYTPSRSRSLGYGISFLASFGFGSFGATIAGWIAERHGVEGIYPRLAVVAGIATLAALSAMMRARRREGT